MPKQRVIVEAVLAGEILRELVIDPDKDSQPRGLKPGPKKASPRKGGVQKGYKRTPKK